MPADDEIAPPRNAARSAPLGDALRERGLPEGASADVARALFEQSPLSTVLYDSAGRIIAVNAAFERLFGLTLGSIPADYSVLTDAQLEGAGHLPAVRRAFEGEAVTLPVVFYDAAALDGVGRRSWTQGHFFPMRDASGAITGVVLVHMNLTELVEAEEARRVSEQRLLADAHAARAEAEAANRAKSEFLAVMSHELRTPLNAIGGYAELLEMGIRGPVTSQQRDDLARIQRSQRHLLGLINEVLNYAKVEIGAVHYDLGEVRVCDVLAAAEGLVAPQARAKGIALSVRECSSEVAMYADADKVRQIVVNLLSNAVKFTDAGGRIGLSCGAGDDGGVRVSVDDTGMGIPADKLAAIFEPFVQVRSDLTRTAEGAGLGLAISRDLARGMGGDLTVESTLGAGSTFTLTLPSI